MVASGQGDPSAVHSGNCVTEDCVLQGLEIRPLAVEALLQHLLGGSQDDVSRESILVLSGVGIPPRTFEHIKFNFCHYRRLPTLPGTLAAHALL